jgi:N6-adenosine-specific RNA methylase IME4/ParB-like chromosome segregation protein Spo0J
METQTKIFIDPEFQALIPPLTEEERANLERDVVREGCRDALVCWRQEDGNHVLIDGHNRFEICQRHGLPFSTTLLELSSREDAMVWIGEHQLHRRNLNESQRAMLAAKIACLKKGARTDLAPFGAMSQTQAACAMKVGRRSVQRAKVVHRHGSPRLNEALNRGLIPVSVGELLTKLSKEEQDEIAGECIECGNAKPAREAVSNLKCDNRVKHITTPDMNGLPPAPVVLAAPWRCMRRDAPDHGVVDHHSVLPLDEIKAVGGELGRHLAPEAVLFVLVPGPLIAEALDLIKAWGFKYCDQIVWMETVGPSEIVKYHHELLLIAVKGSPTRLIPAFRPDSVIEYGRYEDVIEKMYPDLPRLALFARIERPGWSSWEAKNDHATTTANSVNSPDEAVG